MTAKGPSVATSSVITGCFMMYTSMGSTKAAVLPDPVSATPMTSRCCRPMGMAAIWMGEGLMYFCSTPGVR